MGSAWEVRRRPGRLAGATTEARRRSRRATLPSGAFEDAEGERLAIVRPRQQVPLRQLSRPSHVLARSAADPRPSPHPHRSRRTATDQAPARQQCGGARHLDRGGGHRHDRWRGGAERAALSVVVFHTGVEWSREEAVGRSSSIRYSSIWKATATRQLPPRLPAAGAATPGSGARRSGARPSLGSSASRGHPACSRPAPPSGRSSVEVCTGGLPEVSRKAPVVARRRPRPQSVDAFTERLACAGGPLDACRSGSRPAIARRPPSARATRTSRGGPGWRSRGGDRPARAGSASTRPRPGPRFLIKDPVLLEDGTRRVVLGWPRASR